MVLLLLLQVLIVAVLEQTPVKHQSCAVDEYFGKVPSDWLTAPVAVIIAHSEPPFCSRVHTSWNKFRRIRAVRRTPLPTSHRNSTCTLEYWELPVLALPSFATPCVFAVDKNSVDVVAHNPEVEPGLRPIPTPQIVNRPDEMQNGENPVDETGDDFHFLFIVH